MSDEISVPDAEFIARIKAGELDAFGELYRRYVTRIFRYIRTRVSTERDAEDLTEQVFLKAFEALESYEERGAPFSAFLYRVARNAVVDHYRMQEQPEALDELALPADPGKGPERIMMDRQEVQEVERALSRLPEHYQEVIRLRVLMEMPTREVAEWMGKKPATIRVTLHRALKALRKRLGAKHEL